MAKLMKRNITTITLEISPSLTGVQRKSLREYMEKEVWQWLAQRGNYTEELNQKKGLPKNGRKRSKTPKEI